MPRMNLDWQDLALCAQMPINFTPDDHADSVLAQQVCELCEVRTECLATAIARGERWGIWGGLPQDELRELTRNGDTDTEPDDYDEAVAA